MTCKNEVTDEQLAILARRQNELFRRVKEGVLPAETVLTGLQALIEGDGIIDSDAEPFIPTGWKLEEHIKGGPIDCQDPKVQLYVDEVQVRHGIRGHVLRKRLAGKGVVNANVLEYLLSHPRCIPSTWRAVGDGTVQYIFFWGTIYRNRVGDLFVRCLYLGNWGWDSTALPLDETWNRQRPAMVFAR